MRKMGSIALWLGVALWVSLAGIRLANVWQGGQVTSLLLAGQCGLAGWLLIPRREARGRVGIWHILVAWFSAVLPLGLRVPQETLPGQVIQVLGLLIVLWSMASLGRSFGIAPADRGLVKNGPYQFIRHPMYLGEMVCISGVALPSPSSRNILLLTILLLTLLLRIHWEEQAIKDYPGYAFQVRWRLIPFLW